MKNYDEPALLPCDRKSESGHYEGLSYGLSKIEYAAIHICAGLSANPHFAKEESALRIAEISTAQARELFRILESEQ